MLAKTASSVDGLDKLGDEVYLCPSATGYVQPLRAMNVDGKWRTIVNRVESYGIKYTQTARVEECNVVVGTTCSLVPSCYQSKCVQKTVFHRFLVYDANDYTFPLFLGEIPITWILRVCCRSFPQSLKREFLFVICMHNVD